VHNAAAGAFTAFMDTPPALLVPWARSFFADRPDEFFCKPAAIAETVFHVAHQDRSAWTFELDLRPFGEKW